MPAWPARTSSSNLSASDEVIGKQNIPPHHGQFSRAQPATATISMPRAAWMNPRPIWCSPVTSIIAENGRILADSVFPDRPSRGNRRARSGDCAAQPPSSEYLRLSEDGSWYRRTEVSVQPLGGRGRGLCRPALSRQLKQESLSGGAGIHLCRRMMMNAAGAAAIFLQIQANGLATRVRATGIRNLVIGISGGLDSTLALIVCAEARRIVPAIASFLPTPCRTAAIRLQPDL
jgi:NAD+ synthase (glutamine-hydrolysing)